MRPKFIDSVKGGFSGRLSRRDFFKGSCLAGLAAVFGWKCSNPFTSPRISIPTYASIGVRPVINCQGTYTILSGSLMFSEVTQAMEKASKHYVHMDELMEAVGRRLAELTGAEWGLVTSGAAAGLCCVTAACVAGSDPEKMALLPDCSRLKNEVLVPFNHRHEYDHAIRMVGVKLIEVDSKEEMEAGVNDRTAMISVFGDVCDKGPIFLDDMVAIGKKYNVPVMVDAAAERPDVPNVYLQAGADVVVYSGGKCLRGPQCSGLVLGRKDILQAAFLNSAPHHALCRPMKVGKEEIMGLLAAVELWINGRDHEAEWSEWERRLHYISDCITIIPTVKTKVVLPGRSNVAPTLSITWEQNNVKITPREIQKILLNGEPRIQVPLSGRGLSIMPYMMEHGEERTVGERLHEVLSSAA